MSKTGFIEIEPLTWIIPDFHNLAKVGKSPAFIIDNEIFCLRFYEIVSGEIIIWLERRTKVSNKLEIHFFSLDLVGIDGSQLNICKIRKTQFPPGEMCLAGNEVGDAEILMQELSPNYLQDGKMKIHFKIELEPSVDEQDCVLKQIRWLLRMFPQPKLAKLIRLKHKGCLIHDQEDGNCQSLDVVMDCGQFEVPVHRVLLASKSSIFVVREY